MAAWWFLLLIAARRASCPLSCGRGKIQIHIIKAEGTQDFIEPILRSGYSLLPQKQISIDGYIPSECRLNNDLPIVFEESGLRFESYRLTSDDCYQKMEVETFSSFNTPGAREQTDCFAGNDASLYAADQPGPGTF